MTIAGDLSAARITTLPDTAFYIPDFITPEEETQLLEKACLQIASAPKPRWTFLSHRRLQTYPSQLSKNNVLLPEPLPPWLFALVPRMQALGIWDDSPHKQPNHVLVNEYKPQEGIMAHEDGPAYYPMVATVSLGASIVLDIYEKSEGKKLQPTHRILQEPRSLLVTTDTLYTSHLHGIQDIIADENLSAATVANWDLLRDASAFSDGRYERKVRTSLTYRDVLKVGKPIHNLFGRKKI